MTKTCKLRERVKDIPKKNVDRKGTGTRVQMARNTNLRKTRENELLRISSDCGDKKYPAFRRTLACCRAFYQIYRTRDCYRERISYLDSNKQALSIVVVVRGTRRHEISVATHKV